MIRLGIDPERLEGQWGGLNLKDEEGYIGVSGGGGE